MPAPFSSPAALLDNINNPLSPQLHLHSVPPGEMGQFALLCPDPMSFLPESSILHPPLFKSTPSNSHECSLATAFSLSRSHSQQDSPVVRNSPYDMSPSSSVSSDFDHSASPWSTTVSLGKCSLEMFAATRSRVIRLFDVPHFASSFLCSVFAQHATFPITMWELRPDYFGPRHDQRSLWAVFKSHEEACTALSLSGSVISVVPALERDLEPFHKLRRFDLVTPSVSSPHPSSSFPPSSASSASSQVLRMVSSVSDHHKLGLEAPRAAYTISSNPPNPRASFRLGDWLCSSPSCAAHNFGRNVACIGCGYPRSSSGLPPSLSVHSPTRPLASPRFAAPPNLPICFPPTSPTQVSNFPTPSYQAPPTPLFQNIPKPGGLPHPPLTPSGRAFSTGGRVQNVSSDPLTPCVMYWPDNESLPEQGQIRPGGLAGVPQPPILNTGNRGPIEHQPGDWICLKCNYLNWRRRKVCQTCFPYAEGNGDSISAAVQAERIALLTSVLSQNRTLPANPSACSTTSNSYGPRSQSLTPPECLRSFVDISPSKPRGSVHRSQSHFDLGTQYVDSRPIYQTSGNRQPSPSVGVVPIHVHAPAPLLPSFLQDIVQSPTLSPASTSSADLSFEEYDETFPSPVRSSLGRLSNAKESSSNLPPGNIWRLDGEETKTLSALASSNRQDLLGGNQNINQEILRLSTINIA